MEGIVIRVRRGVDARTVAAGHEAGCAVLDGEVGDREHHVAHHRRVDGVASRDRVAALLLAPLDVARARIVLVRIDRMRHEPLVDVQGHLLVARPGHVRRELREDCVLTQDEAHGLQHPVVVDEGAEDLALVGQKGHPLVDVVVRFDRDIRRSVADAPLRRALLEHPLANPCRRLRIERALEHAEAVFAQIRLEPVHPTGEPRSTRHRAFTSSRHRVHPFVRSTPQSMRVPCARGPGAWRCGVRRSCQTSVTP